MCLEAGDGGVKYDVKRVNLGKNYLGIVCEKPGRFRRPILPRLLTLGCNRTKMAEDPLRSELLGSLKVSNLDYFFRMIPRKPP